MTSEATRPHRVAHLLQKELGQMLVEDLKDPRIGFTTVTEVRLSGDLRAARVYVSVYGSEDQRAETLIGLRAASGFLKRELGRRLRLKYTPDLTFLHDDSLERAKRLDELMDAISAGETEPPTPAADDVLPVQTDRSELAARRQRFAETQPRRSKKRTRRGRRSR
ncbi:30S ribosome-binding factor RbfA [Myxococcota bacterium]